MDQQKSRVLRRKQRGPTTYRVEWGPRADGKQLDRYNRPRGGEVMRFRVQYTDPVSGDEVSFEQEYEAMPGLLTARDVAEDHAYALADKGPFTVTELRSK